MIKKPNLLNLQILKKLSLLVIFAAASFFSFYGLASAAPCPIQPQTGTCAPGTSNTSSTDCKNATDLKDNCIVKDIQLVVDFLSVGVGIIVVGVIIFGGIRYAAAGDNPQAVTAAKQHVVNGLIALVAYIFTFAFLQWVIPGGIL